MNGHGGKRPGAGRPTGAASRANDEVRQEAAATGELPLAYMLRIMRDPSQPVGRRDDMAKAAHLRGLAVPFRSGAAIRRRTRARPRSCVPTAALSIRDCATSTTARLLKP